MFFHEFSKKSGEFSRRLARGSDWHEDQNKKCGKLFQSSTGFSNTPICTNYGAVLVNVFIFQSDDNGTLITSTACKALQYQIISANFTVKIQAEM